MTFLEAIPPSLFPATVLPTCGILDKSSSGNTETSANLSNNNKSSSTSISCSQGSPVATTLAGSGMGNPFARPPPSATWGQASESSDPKPILAPSRLGPSSDAGATKVSSSGGSSVLRQPTLSAGRPSASMKSPSSLFTPPTPTVTVSSPPQPSRSAFKLKPSVLGSTKPFGKISSNSDSRVDSACGSEEGASKHSGETSPHSLDVSSSSSVTTSNTVAASSGDRDHSLSDSRTSSSSSNSISNSSSSSNMFVPLSRNGDGTDSSLSPTIRNSSIFGQNLISKVTGAESSVTSSSDAASATTNGERQTGNLFTEAATGMSRISDSGAATNGRIGGTGNLFSEAASEILPENAWNSGPSLAETSRELTEKENSQKRKFDQVEVITGEESESNVLQMNCKLYAWVCGSWQERGRGILRLNDWDAGQEIHSRLVIRTQGTLTVMLNTKVWAEMSVERASNKSVRFTALDADGQPKIFLAMGSPKDVDLLYNSLEWRVAASRSQTHEEGDSDNTKKAKKEEAGATAL
ncbi:LOW QUALITY PROTEIN: ran-binding protein 3-like, partial [Palaemon carinicauda]|uniref:LOW QUALITY PROTEIN: ran-binding protein 3-like n=1 Tax=Palaemon carinicauda TaxID=392227 RepID=UPI0035B66674